MFYLLVARKLLAFASAARICSAIWSERDRGSLLERIPITATALVVARAINHYESKHAPEVKYYLICALDSANSEVLF